MSTIVGILVGILIFCIIIVFHEFGHLIIAKRNGISVPEFQVGFGPKLCKFKIGETEYSIRLILFGGACKMLGENGEAMDDARSFTSKGPWARLATIFAGPFFNFILAFVVSIIVIGIVGYDPAYVTSVTADGPAAEAGLKKGDIITSFNKKNIAIGRELATYFTFNELDGKDIVVGYEREGEEYSTTITPLLVRSYKLGFYYNADDTPCTISSLVSGGVLEKAEVKASDVIISINDVSIETGKAFSEYIAEHPLDGNEITITFNRGGKGEIYTLSLVPEFVENYTIGFTYNANGREKTTPLKVIKYSFYEVRYWIVNTVKSLGLLFRGKLKSDDLGGPVRIVSELENTVEASKSDGILYVVLNLMNWAILLSANLGVMNLLPIPALDGGRMIFIIIELIRGKPVPPEKEGMVHAIGIIVLMALMVFVFFNDIKNVFFR
ncbi:MAG: RIP metalloprotease RseP [Lachnospiraceae bacterium]|nr:RIP metalloprotease RseP [Lachnospiraceae bacterium]